MTNEIISNPNESELQWESLSDKQKGVLIAMLIAKDDKEAIDLSPVAKTQYYKYKKDLASYKELVVNEITKKALQVLQGNSIRAAEAISDMLDSHNLNIKYKAAVEVLDRTVGQPQKQQVEKPNITMLAIQGITQKDLQMLTEPEKSSP